MLSLPLCCISNSDINSSRSHPCHDWHRTKTSPAFNDIILLFVLSDLLSLVARVPGRFEVVRVCFKSFCRHYFFPLATSKLFGYIRSRDVTRLLFITCFGSIGDKFEFTNVRSYSPKSEFFDVFKQAKCPNLDFKRIFICLCLRSFDGRKTLINRLVSNAFIGSSRDHENVDGSFVIENNNLLYTKRNFKALKLYRIFRKFTYFYDTIANLVSQFYIIADV